MRYIGACLGTPQPRHSGTSSSKKVENAWIRKNANAYAYDELEKMSWMHMLMRCNDLWEVKANMIQGHKGINSKR